VGEVGIEIWAQTLYLHSPLPSIWTWKKENYLQKNSM